MFLSARLAFDDHEAALHVLDEEGEALAEYGLLVTVIAVAVMALALTVFRNAIAGVFNPIAQCLNGNGNGQFP